MPTLGAAIRGAHREIAVEFDNPFDRLASELERSAHRDQAELMLKIWA